MSDEQPDRMAPQTSGSEARGTQAGGGEPPEDLPDRHDDAGGERMRKAQEDYRETVDEPIEGEGTTEEARQQAIDTAAGPQGEAAPGAGATRPQRDEPDPGGTGGA